VGNDGETLVADSSTSTGLRYQSAYNGNACINGAMDIWQRGTANTTSSLVYTADRWQKSSNTAYGVSRQTTSDTTNLPNITFALRAQRTAGSTSTTIMELNQTLENSMSMPLIGQTATLSFYARAGANFSASGSSLTVAVYGGTGTDQNLFTGMTGVANLFSAARTLTTTWQRFQITGPVGATYTQLALYFAATPTGTAGANDWFEITGVQLELGSIATTFKRSGGTIQGELAACQRYYFKATASSAYTTFGVGANYSTTATQIHVNHPVQMRIGPASVDYSTLGLVNSIGGIVTFTTLTLSFTGPLTSMLGVTGASGLVAGYANLLLANNSTSGYLAFSSEL
jgi:hypothetical protein